MGRLARLTRFFGRVEFVVERFEVFEALDAVVGCGFLLLWGWALHVVGGRTRGEGNVRGRAIRRRRNGDLLSH